MTEPSNPRPGVFQLVAGCRVSFEGRRWQVTTVTKRVDGMRLVGLANPSLGEMEIELADLVRLGGFKVVDSGVTSGLPARAAEMVAGSDEARRVQELVGHLLEVQTGFKSGTPHRALSAEPRPEYDLDRTGLRDRVESKAVELERSVRSIWRLLKRLDDKGSAGLFDQRKLRAQSADQDVLPQEYVAAARRVIEEGKALSKKPRQQQVAAVNRLVEIDCDERGVPVPPAAPYRIQRLLRDLEEAAGLHLLTKGRRSSSGRAERHGRGFDADALGEKVIFDTWPLDLLVVDDRTGEYIQTQMSVGLDLLTGAAQAYEIYVKSERGMDIALLIHRMLLPERWDPAWGPEARWIYTGVPESLVVAYGEAWGVTIDEPSNHVPMAPAAITVDQGTVYLSRSVMNVCRQLGMTIDPARARTGTDKGPVERLFGSINAEFLSWYPTHRGRHVGERGSGIEKLAAPTLSAVRKAFKAYMVSEYPNVPRDGLRLPGAPHSPLTVNQAIDLALQQQGLVLTVPDPALVIDLLPQEFREVTHSGVSVHNLDYWDPVLRDFIGVTSPHGGAARGRYVVAVNPDNPLVAWIFHPQEQAWYPLEATNVRRPGAPMSAAEDEWLSATLAGEGTDWRGIEEARWDRYKNRTNEQIERTYTKGGKRRAALEAARSRDQAERYEELMAPLLGAGSVDDDEPEQLVDPEPADLNCPDVTSSADSGDDDTPVIGARSYRPGVDADPPPVEDDEVEPGETDKTC